MVDSETAVLDLDKTESNRERVREFILEVLIGNKLSRLPEFVHDTYTEHSPALMDVIAALGHLLQAGREGQSGNDTNSDHVPALYSELHILLADGNFVLSACEGQRDQVQTALFDLYRMADGKIVEHWDTTEAMVPRSEWKNDNGKF